MNSFFFLLNISPVRETSKQRLHARSRPIFRFGRSGGKELSQDGPCAVAGVRPGVVPRGGGGGAGGPAVPKWGLLSYSVAGFDPSPNNPAAGDVVFVPVGLNYDRVLEDRVLIGLNEADPAPRFPVSIWTMSAFVLRLVWLLFSGRHYRFGYAFLIFC